MMLQEFVAGMPQWAQTLIHTGYMAVQSFFILSGFVLARSYAGAVWSRPAIVNYIVARFARIYPVYLFSLVVVSPFIIDAMIRPTRTLAVKVGLLVNYGLVLQGWKGNLGVGWNTPAWSLTCEFFFYAFFPFLLSWLSKAGKITITLVLLVTVVTPVLLAHAEVPWHWKPLYHFSDFVAGIAASRLYDFGKSKLKGRGAWLYLPATVAGIALVIHPQAMDGTYGDLNTGLRPLNVIAILGFAFGGGSLARWLSGTIAEFLGKASYSLYILHVPVLWWYSKWALRRPMPVPRLAAAGLYVILVIAVAALAFQYIEMPANGWLRRKGKRRAAKSNAKPQRPDVPCAGI